MKIYISGPMTGIPYFNSDAFNNAAQKLRNAGWDVINPIELDAAKGDKYEEEAGTGVWESKHRTDYLRRDLLMLADKAAGITAIYMLLGWEKSKGARLEKAVAEGLGLEVLFERKGGQLPAQAYISWRDFCVPGQFIPVGSGWEPLPEEAGGILDRAKKLVHGDRGASYGHPLDDFTRTAGAASSLGFRFLEPSGDLRHLKAEDIPNFMICVKLSRETNKPGPQNLEDIAGYAETKHMVAEERKKRENDTSTQAR